MDLEKIVDILYKISLLASQISFSMLLFYSLNFNELAYLRIIINKSEKRGSTYSFFQAVLPETERTENNVFK